MFRPLNEIELEMVSGGAKDNPGETNPPIVCEFPNVESFGTWLGGIDFDLGEGTVSVTILDGAGWDLGAYADFNTDNWDNVQFEGAGLTLTIEL
jgi:hypothetical protein